MVHQKCIYRLIAEAMDECDQLKEHKILLVMAKEQLNLEVPDIVERVEILLDTYLSLFDCYHESLEVALEHLKETASIVLPSID